jgi:arginine decarboxylase
MEDNKKHSKKSRQAKQSKQSRQAKQSGATLPARVNLDYYHSPTQLRFDTWYALEDYTQRLRDKYRKGGDTRRLLNETREALETLCVIEEYTAFPSHDDCQYLWTLLEGEDYSLLAQTVSYIVRVLSSELYRLRNVDLANTKELYSPDATNDASRRVDSGGQHQHYFEVLIVDDGSEEDLSSLRANLRQVRRPEDNFIYDVVIVSSLEDALIAVLFNYNIQACVIRYGFPLHSKNHLELLQRYLVNIDESTYEDTPEKERGPLLNTFAN